MTCVAGQYSAPGFASLAEGLLRESGAGAVAVVAPTGLSQDEDAAAISRRLMELLAGDSGGCVGDLWPNLRPL